MFPVLRTFTRALWNRHGLPNEFGIGIKRHMQHYTCSTALAIQKMQYGTCSMLHATWHMQYDTCSLLHALWLCACAVVYCALVCYTAPGIHTQIMCPDFTLCVSTSNVNSKGSALIISSAASIPVESLLVAHCIVSAWLLHFWVCSNLKLGNY